jgi:hypothetical protein
VDTLVAGGDFLLAWNLINLHELVCNLSLLGGLDCLQNQHTYEKPVKIYN